ncbi:hypothetical protein Sste5346_004992 [Sporothrix stenoceras]|uniref:Transcription factor domain-containing protein n=1 Tax=Sporothrix stenoceras TaxID=5173 RepID=A0ABR3Z6E4_9PEZI
MCTGFGRTLIYKFTWTSRTSDQLDEPRVINVELDLANTLINTLSEQEHYIGLFWEYYLPNGHQFSDEACGYTTCGWTRIAQDLCSNSTGWNDSASCIRVVRLAIIANSLCMIGNQYQETHTVEYGYQAYGTALKQMRNILMQKMLTQGAIPLTDQEKLILLIGARLLTVFTILFQRGRLIETSTDQSEAWVNLNAGEMTLLLSREPEAYQNGNAHQIFVDTRLHLIIPYLIPMRRPRLLTHESWMEVPWEVVPKTPMDRLVDLIGLLPALVEDLHAAQSGPVICLVDKVVLTPVMKLRFDALVAKLQSWRNEIVPGLGMEELFLSQRTRASNKRKRDPEAEGSSSTRPQLQTSTSTSTSTPDLDLAKAHALVLFWATCLLYARKYADFTFEDIDVLPPLLNVRANRYNMLRVLANVHFSPRGRNKGGWFGINVALFPLRVAMATVPCSIDDKDYKNKFPLSPAESKLMESIYTECKARGVASFIDSISQYLSTEAN